MAVKISELPTASLVTSDDVFPIVDGGTIITQKATAQQMLNYISGSTFNTLTVTTLTSSNITGTIAQFTNITASHSGSGAGLYNIPTTALTANTITVGSTGIALGNSATTIQGLTTLTSSNVTGILSKFTTISGTNANISGDLVVGGRLTAQEYFTEVVSASIIYESGSTKFGNDSGDTHQFSGSILLSGTLNANNIISGTTSQFTIISGSTVTGSIALLTTITGSTVTGSTARFTTITGSTVTGSTALFTTISASNVNVSGGNLIIYETASIGDYAYILYNGTYDKLVAFPGLYVSGNLTGSGNAAFQAVSGTTAQFTTISGSTVTGTLALFTTLTGSTITGSTARFTTVSASVVSASSYVGLSGSIVAGGTNTTIQFNSGSVFTGSTKLVWDYTNNRLGVGISSPSQSLHVSGVLRVQSSSSWDFDASDSTTLQIIDRTSNVRRAVFNTSGDVFLGGSINTSTGGNAAFVVSGSSGNVGIGTTAPTSKLEVNAGTLSSQIPAVRVNATLSSDNSEQTGIEFNITSSGANNRYQYGLMISMLPGYTGNSGTHSSYFLNNCLGTGTTPLLDGKANYGFFGNAYNPTDSSGIRVGGQGNAQGSTTKNYGLIGRAVGTSGSPSNIGVYGHAVNSGGTPTTVGGMFTLYGATDSIGTLTNSALIADNASISAPIFIARDNGTEVLRIADGGNVGIGTAIPDYKLAVIAPSGDGIVARVFSNTADDRPVISLDRNRGTEGSYSAVQSGDNLGEYAWAGSISSTSRAGSSIVRSTATENWGPGTIGSKIQLFTVQNGTFTKVERLTISHDGLVGIRNASPSVALDVSGSARITGSLTVTGSTTLSTVSGTTAQFTTLTGSTAYFSGNVGIGTTSPSSILHVKNPNAGTSQITLSNTNSGGIILAVEDPGAFGNYTFEIRTDSTGAKIGHNSSNRDLQLRTNNTTALTIDTSQRIGIGTTTPNAKLEVYELSSDSKIKITSDSSTSRAYLQVANNNSKVWEFNCHGSSVSSTLFGLSRGNKAELISNTAAIIGTITSDNLTLGTNSIASITIDTSQNVGIGKTSPSAKLDVAGDIIAEYIAITPSSGAGNKSYLTFNARTNPGNVNNNVAQFIADAGSDASNSSFVLNMIDSDGGGWDNGFVFKPSPSGDDFTYVGIGTLNPTVRLDVVGNGTTAARFSSGNVIISGNLTVTGSISELSTRRIKTNIQSMTNQLYTVNQLNPVSYVRLDDNRKEYGFISEEVKEVYPEFVVGEGINYPKMVSVLVSAVKELTQKVEKQQIEIEQLKNKTSF
jgi:hypothetical protein